MSGEDSVEGFGGNPWWHYIIVCLSFLVTFLAWYIATSQEDQRIAARFDREADHIFELTIERMGKYEDALWAGVGLLRSAEEVTREAWRRYVETMRTDKKYPGINGIGLILNVPQKDLATFEQEQKESFPEFRIYPEHNREPAYPITYIEPLGVNRQALGLDIAHESNRFVAANKARDSGTAQITGPIVLVQDETKTPGFLFYAPFYSVDNPQTVKERRQSFVGMVYAPFVVRKLMEGTLRKENRHVGIRIKDGQDLLYDELTPDEPDFDPEPLHKRSVTLSIYGREWTFDIWSSLNFRKAAYTNQSRIILVAGIFIDLLLIALFYTLARTSRKIHEKALSLTTELRTQTKQLEETNQQLEKFSYLAAHDLKSPLRAIRSRASWAIEDAGDTLSPEARQHLEQLSAAASRMGQLLDDLLSYSRSGLSNEEKQLLDLETLVREEIELLHAPDGMEIQVNELPDLFAAHTPVRQVFRNLIENAIKYHTDPENGRIEISAYEQDGASVFCVEDNGPGIPEKHHRRIFEMFERLKSKKKTEGTGMGLAIVKKIVESQGGEVSLESELGAGARFSFTWPSEQNVKEDAE